MIKVVFPSAGHNINDPGAVYNGRKESQEMMCLRTLVVDNMNKLGHENVPDMDSETASQHQSRIKTGNGSVVCEFHLNASANLTASGTEAIVSNDANALSKAMAKELTDVTAKIMGIKNRGVKPESETARGRIGIVHKAGTTVLLEVCFLSNRTDMAAFDKFKVSLAKAYSDILIKYDNKI